MIKEITGMIEELCIYPEYEFWSPLLDDLANPLDNTPYTPALSCFKATPAFLYYSSVEDFPTPFGAKAVIFRLSLISPRHLHLKPRIMAETITPKQVLQINDKMLELFTLQILKEIKV